LKPFDRSGEFQDPNAKADLSRMTVSNAGITIFAQSCMFAIQLLGTMVLARMLAPADFGLVTMVTTFTLLLASFGLAGFTEAILQTEKINHSLASTLFWINVGGGLILAVAFGAAGPLLARFYSDPRIAHVAIGFALAIFFSVAPIIHLSLAKRGMRFAAVSVNDIVGRFAYLLTAIGCAYLGWGYWALVAGAVVQPLVISVGAAILCPWLPGLPRRGVGACKMVRYAANVYGRFSLNYGTGNTDNLLVGWRFGAPALGFYKKAFDLFVLPSCQLMAPILAVVVGTLSRKNKDREDFKRYFLKGLCIVTFVGMAASADLTLIGRDLVRLLLGPKWGEAGRIFTYFAPGIGLMLVYQTSGWLHLSLGTTGRWIRWTVIELTVTFTLFLLGLHWGPAGVAGAWTTSFIVLTVPAFWYAGAPIELPVLSVIKAVWRYLISALIAGFACAGMVASMPWLPLIAASGLTGVVVRMVTNSVLFTALYLGAVVVLFGGLEPVRQFIRLLPDLLPGVSAWRRSRSVAEPAYIVESPVVGPAAQEVTLENKY
jgi:polysaccharide transporter, PST family